MCMHSLPSAFVFSLPWHVGIMLSRVISARLGGSEVACSFIKTSEEALSVTHKLCLVVQRVNYAT